MADKGASCVFAEDVVCLKENESSTKFGLVVKSGSNISDSEDSLDSEEEEEERVKSGELLVCWYPAGQEEVIAESKVVLVDRSLQPGDVVRHKDPEKINQKGYVTDIQVTTDICILGTQKIIKDVDGKKYLTPLQALTPWTRIAFGPWVGYITNVYRRVVLWLKNGSKCSLEEKQLSMLYDISDKRDEDSPFYNQAFFPSQSVVGPARAFKEAKWLSKVKPILCDQNHVRAVVEEAKVVKIEVDWQVCGLCPPGCKEQQFDKPPDKTINEDQLDQVKIFEHYSQAELQLGDKGYYIVKEEDIEVIEDTNSEACLKTKATVGIKQSKDNVEERTDDTKIAEPDCNAEQMCFETNEKLDDAPTQESTMPATSRDHVNGMEEDLKQGGACASESDIESDGLEQPKPKSLIGEVFPGLIKHSTRRRRNVRLRRKRKMQFTVKTKSGDRVCIEVIKTKTLAHVMWQDGHLEKELDTLNLIPTVHIDEHQFFPGYFVADKRAENSCDKYGVVQYAKYIDRTCTVKWFGKTGDDLNVEEDVSVYDIVEHPDFVFNPGDVVVGIVNNAEVFQDAQSKGQSLAGQVVGVNQDGNVEVAWVGGSGRHCFYKPQNLYKVESEDEDDDFSDTSYSDDDDHSEVNSDDSDADEWETASEESDGINELNHDMASEENDGINELHQNIANEESSDHLITPEPSSPIVENVDIEALINANNTTARIPASEPVRVEGFLMLSEAPVSHKFRNTETFTATVPRKFMSVLRKEILLLQSSLPPGILIRGFDNSMELFSVLIYGPDDTPYEDGLFFFDIALPADYPSVPPSVSFLSYSKNSLNPNLYVDGTVCISLLGTWNGKNNEVWTAKSNILQLLLSIQGLILCKEPYYNEAGYEKQRGTVDGEANARIYNEMVILHLVASMETIINTTHCVFEKEIKDHFEKKGEKIIQRFQSWISQANCLDKNSEETVAAVTDDDNVSGSSSSAQAETSKVPGYPLFPLSKGFLICLERSTEKLAKRLEGKKV